MPTLAVVIGTALSILDVQASSEPRRFRSPSGNITLLQVPLTSDPGGAVAYTLLSRSAANTYNAKSSSPEELTLQSGEIVLGEAIVSPVASTVWVLDSGNCAILFGTSPVGWGRICLRYLSRSGVTWSRSFDDLHLGLPCAVWNPKRSHHACCRKWWVDEETNLVLVVTYCGNLLALSLVDGKSPYADDDIIRVLSASSNKYTMAYLLELTAKERLIAMGRYVRGAFEQLPHMSGNRIRADIAQHLLYGDDASAVEVLVAIANDYDDSFRVFIAETCLRVWPDYGGQILTRLLLTQADRSRPTVITELRCSDRGGIVALTTAALFEEDASALAAVDGLRAIRSRLAAEALVALIAAPRRLIAARALSAVITLGGEKAGIAVRLEDGTVIDDIIVSYFRQVPFENAIRGIINAIERKQLTPAEREVYFDAMRKCAGRDLGSDITSWKMEFGSDHK